MFSKTMVRGFLATALAATVLAVPSRAEVIPPTGLAPGSQYQLIFETSECTAAWSADISYYNSFVTQQAALSSSLPAATWSAVASTWTVNASANAPVYDSVPIFNTRGQLVATGTQLWSGELSSLPEYDQNGDLFGGLVWTGSLPDGAIAPLPLGTGGSSYFGDLDSPGPGQWIDHGVYLPSGSLFSLYGLSSPITVPVPEPGTVTLLGPAMSGLAGVARLRRCRAKA